MQISYNWLLDYLPYPVSINDLSHILTSIGLEVEAIEKSEAIPGGLEGLVIGKVETCEQHPNADKLKTTTVNTGNSALLHIVCGAPNVAPGQKVIVAPIGTTVHPMQGEPFLIKKSKIRGAISEGMICAEDEIGLGNGHDGIMVLPDEAVIGTLARDYFKIPPPDYTIHIGLTPNRSDGNSHIGVARDVCAYMTHHSNIDGTQASVKWDVKFPSSTVNLLSEATSLPIDIKIEADAACPRYAGVTIKGITVAPSPDWLVQRLKTIGVRTVNNVVDITNYVLHEYGQPLHAFDYDKIARHRIIVKYPVEGQKFVGLDEKVRELRAEDLMICDAEKELCIAGVFGGTGSGVTEITENLFLESAYFDPRSIRKTSMHHGLRTDAATHFEKGVDIEMVVSALKRTAYLITSIAGGTIASNIADIYLQKWQAPVIQVAYSYINNLCGKEYAPELVDRILKALGFTLQHTTPGFVELEVPSNKPDIRQPADVAEEILRIDGLDKVEIPSRLNISLQNRTTPPVRLWKERIADYLTHNGMQEIVTNSITNSKYYPDHTSLVRMINSLSSELDIMRPEILESGLEVIAYNLNRKQQDLKLYEFGNIYTQEATGNYKQTSLLALWITGNVKTQHWQHPATTADIYYIKGILQSLFTLCGISKMQESFQEGLLEWKRGKHRIARAFAVPEAKKKLFDIKQDVFYAEVDVQVLTEAIENVKTKYSELPKYPSMKRDLSLVLDKHIPYSSIAAIARTQRWEALRDYELFDVFESEKLGAGKKSIALSFTFQLNNRTLTDEEVDSMMKQLINLYQKDLQAQVRE